MKMQTASHASAYEQTIIGIMRRLPPERVLQIVDFAQFLELQAAKGYDDWSDEEETETEEQVRASEEKWDELFAKPEAKRVMREMAREAREEYRAGRTTDIATTEDGRLAPA
ncbi:MAG: hypothetical protein KKC18_06235 [Chloroflexi bacterium]|nr:hypothetical protein [Chloroflexota bacterium]